MMTTQEKADALFEDQKSSWPQLGGNWEKLGAARLRKFDFDGFTIQVQFNPKRIVSSAAKVDKLSIEKRKCFLCTENRPPEEKSVWFGEDYEILCNPFPIFREHFTIAKSDHTPQEIEHEFFRFLDLSQELPDLVMFYNAPSCGASAPDHMHFQAGNRGFMPLEDELGTIKQKYGNTMLHVPGLTVTAIEDGLRRFVLLESNDRASLNQLFQLILEFVRKLQQGEEPMINMLSYYRDGWQIMIFPREKHRPWQYFEEGEKNILLSPASVDMGGMLITPLEKDFQKITREEIEDIFSQVSFSQHNFAKLTGHLNDKLRSYEE
ncbi:MAG: DUF4922 domain-containing protein [Bacteroidota bacterium]